MYVSKATLNTFIRCKKKNTAWNKPHLINNSSFKRNYKNAKQPKNLNSIAGFTNPNPMIVRIV